MRLHCRIHALCLPGLLLAALCGSCSTEVASLHVDVVTDFLPQVEFDTVRVEIGEGAELTFADYEVGTDDYFQGVRVTSIPMMDEQTHVRVGLFLFGEEVVFRSVSVPTTGNSQAVTIVLTRDCEGVVCPSGSASSCLGGRCVDPRCTVASPEFCPTPECSRDADCAAAGCAVARCGFGVCLADSREGNCPAGEFCHGTQGCRPIPLGDCLDVSCLDGETCVEGVGCVPPSTCDPAQCEANLSDATRCEIGECSDTGFCRSVSTCVDDDNPCTTVSCGGGGCEQLSVEDGISCDTGDFCTSGHETCQAGVCVAPGPPCGPGLECDEALGRCVGCLVDDNCPIRPPVPGEPFFGSECSDAGFADDIRFVASCVEGACVDQEEVVTREVFRETNGASCGEGTSEMIGRCMNYGGVCSAEGTRQVTLGVSACQLGSCVTNTQILSRSCRRPTPTTRDCEAPQISTSFCIVEEMCGTDGIQTETTRDSDCESGTCVLQPGLMTSTPCIRPPPTTEGCAPSETMVGLCTGRDVCDLSGTETVLTTTYNCGAGSCNAQAPSMTTRVCSRSTNGSVCGLLGACQSGTCEDCADGLENHGETGIDCGGPCAFACPTCSDGIQNQGETSVDCGGPCEVCT